MAFETISKPRQAISGSDSQVHTPWCVTANGNVQNTGDFIYTLVEKIPAGPPNPTINSLTAATTGLSQAVAAMGGPVTLTVNGENYGALSKVYAGTAALTTSFVSSTQLTAVIPAASLREVKTLNSANVTAEPERFTDTGVTVNIDNNSGTVILNYF